jgi:predicted NBD/HSP70 family sugar kinase
VNGLASLNVHPSVTPPLDPGFVPAALVNRAVREEAQRGGAVPLRLALERTDGSISTYETIALPARSTMADLNLPYAERLAKFLMWQRGGWKLYVGGPAEVAEHLREVYSPTGARAFDYDFMSSVYERPFTIVHMSPDEVPDSRETTSPLGRHLNGCRVGFDLGASDRKSSAVIDGEAVFSVEVPWDPRNQSDPAYHYEGIMDSIERARAHLPRLDAVGGSAAGVYIGNRVRVASLFRGVPKEVFEERVAGMFIEIGKQLGVPLVVVNDGEVTALAGSMSLEDNPVLGIAMGSSQAAGYVTPEGNITGWLNELAFAPVDYRPSAPIDEWSGDGGCGVQYFSQQGAIRVAESAGMVFEAGLDLPRKLEALQAAMLKGDDLAREVYETIGVYLGYAVGHYADFYTLKHILVLGRVTTGPGGDILIEQAQKVLKQEFPELAEQVSLALPDEKSRRVGQSIAAASLPEIP